MSVKLSATRRMLQLLVCLQLVIVFTVCFFHRQRDEYSSKRSRPAIYGNDQCRAMFTISSPEKNIENEIDTTEPSRNNILPINFASVRRSVMNLIKSKPQGVSTELYESISQFLPSLLTPAGSSNTNKSQEWMENNIIYWKDKMTSQVLAKYREYFLNTTGSHVPLPKLMANINADQFALAAPRELPPVMIKDKFEILPFSRMAMAEGRLPYIPCKVRDYSTNDFQRCIQARMERNETTWISFVGDSKLRCRFEDILDSTPDFQWKILLKGKEVPYKHYISKIVPMKINANIEASSSTGLRMSFAWATAGDTTEYPALKVPITLTTEWLRDGEDVPDVNVIGFGPWIYQEAHNERLQDLTAEDQVIEHWESMKQVISRLASKTTVLLMTQSRLRTHILETRVPHNESMGMLAAWFHRLLYQSIYRDHSNDWIDKVMFQIAEETDAIIWDSTLPLNLANLRECGILKQAQQEDHPAYENVMKCRDTHHPSPPTIQDEVMMIVNLLCNKRLQVSSEYCCG